MLFGLLTFLVIALTAGLLGFGVMAFSAAGAPKILLETYRRVCWDSVTFALIWFRRSWAGALATARRIRKIRLDKWSWQSGLIHLLIGTTLITAILVAVGFRHVYFDRTGLPDIEPFARFEFPTIGTVFDANGQPLIELAREYRRIIRY